MAYIEWKIMEFTHDSIQRNKLSKNVQFGSVTEILMVGFLMKFW